MRPRSSSSVLFSSLALALAGAVAAWPQASPRPVPAGTIEAARLAGFYQDAALVFRGRCTGFEVGEAVVGGGARVAATTYTFELTDSLKGTAARTVRFRQVGTPEGGPRDLGALAGVPVYQPGAEYLLFLLPAGPRSGLTSPAGAAEGAFAVAGEALRPLAPGHLARLGPAAGLPAPAGAQGATGDAGTGPAAGAAAVPLTWSAVRAALLREAGQ
jgi:hypothetical protein